MRSSLRNNIGLALLRLLPSALLLIYGIPKLQKLIAGNFEFPDPIGIGAAPSLFLTVIAEFLCTILIIIGYKTRWAAIPVIITMLVAAFIVHAADPFSVKEHAITFAIFFSAIALLGPGKYSLDRK